MNTGDITWVLVSTGISNVNDTRPRAFLRWNGPSKKSIIDHHV
jgi:hypothetical protein